MRRYRIRVRTSQNKTTERGEREYPRSSSFPLGVFPKGVNDLNRNQARALLIPPLESLFFPLMRIGLLDDLTDLSFIAMAYDDSIDEREQISLCEALDRVLNKGAVVVGEVTISVANIDLIYLGLQLILTSIETAREALGTNADQPPLTGILQERGTNGGYVP